MPCAAAQNPHQVRAGRARARNATRNEHGRFTCRQTVSFLEGARDFLAIILWWTLQRLYRTFAALVLLFVIEGCAPIPIGPGSAPPMDPPFDAYNFCIQKRVTDAGRQDCFKQVIQASHLALPTGTTAEEAYAKYKSCRKDVPTAILVGPILINGNNEYKARQKCFESVLQ
jgi:hypothetical protein